MLDNPTKIDEIDKKNQHNSKIAVTNKIFRCIVIQGLAVVLMATIALLSSSTKTAYSVLLGGFICLAANACFALQLWLASRTPKSAKQVLSQFYRAEMFKWLLTIILFYCVIRFVELDALPFFIAYLATQWVSWVFIL